MTRHTDSILSVRYLCSRLQIDIEDDPWHRVNTPAYLVSHGVRLVRYHQMTFWRDGVIVSDWASLSSAAIITAIFLSQVGAIVIQNSSAINPNQHFVCIQFFCWCFLESWMTQSSLLQSIISLMRCHIISPAWLWGNQASSGGVFLGSHNLFRRVLSYSARQCQVVILWAEYSPQLNKDPDWTPIKQSQRS
jgi:hypothetical protein